MNASTDAPEAVIQRQFAAFNARDVEAIAATYAADACQYEHPSKLLASGLPKLRERWTARFKDVNLRATLINRVVAGNIVIDHEEVAGTYPEGVGKIELVAIYDVRDGKIANAWFIFGAKTLNRTK